MNCTPFGYFPKSIEVEEAGIEIHTRSDLDSAVAAIQSDEHVLKEWIYSPLQQESGIFSGVTRTLPFPARLFTLPMTHTIVGTRDEDHLRFHLWVLSLFLRTRLSHEQNGWIDAAPVMPGQYFDFVEPDTSSVLAIAEVFSWTHAEKPLRAKRVGGAINALLLAQNPLLLQYEQFSLLYTALDACFKVASDMRKAALPHARLTHSDRIAWMCDQYSVPKPAWAGTVGASSLSELARVRNEAIHEALYIGSPLGYSIFAPGTGKNLPLEMTNLVTRLLCGLLGAEDASYLRTPCDSYQMHEL